jgi:hypothetical protein
VKHFIEKENIPHSDPVSSGISHWRILDSFLEGCQVIGFDWRYIYVNDTVAKQAQTSKEHLIGRTIMEAHPGIESSHLFSLLRECMNRSLTPNRQNRNTNPLK